MRHSPVTSDVEKAIEAAGVLLRKENSRCMSRLRLLKLLYVANRRSIKDLGRPLFKSGVSAMPHGPVHSEVYDLIKENHPQADRWAKFIGCDGPRNLHLIRQPATSKLSKHEIEILQRISDDLAQLNDWELAELTHEFPEWISNYSADAEENSRPIPIEDVVRAVVGDFADDVAADIREKEEYDRLFQS